MNIVFISIMANTMRIVLFILISNLHIYVVNSSDAQFNRTGYALKSSVFQNNQNKSNQRLNNADIFSDLDVENSKKFVDKKQETNGTKNHFQTNRIDLLHNKAQGFKMHDSHISSYSRVKRAGDETCRRNISWRHCDDIFEYSLSANLIPLVSNDSFVAAASENSTSTFINNVIPQCQTTARYEMPSYECFCDDQCRFFGDCCFKRDGCWTNNTDTTLLESMYGEQISDAVDHWYVSSPHGFWLDSLQRRKCMWLISGSFWVISDYYDTSGHLYPCESTKPSSDFTAWVPVIDIKTHTGVYLNAICAEKNGIDKDGYGFVEVYLDCFSGLDFVSSLTSSTLTSQGFENCEARIYTEDRFYCIPDVQYRCYSYSGPNPIYNGSSHSNHNDSQSNYDRPQRVHDDGSNSKVFDSILITYNNESLYQFRMALQNEYSSVTLCNAFIEPMIDLRTYKIFKNVFCAICSGITYEEIYSYFGCLWWFPTIHEPKRVTPTSFRLLITPSISDAEPVHSWMLREQVLCDESQLWDFSADKCVDIISCDKNTDLIHTNESIGCVGQNMDHGSSAKIMLQSTISDRNADALSIVFSVHASFADIANQLVSLIARFQEFYKQLKFRDFYHSPCVDMVFHNYPNDISERLKSEMLCIKLEFYFDMYRESNYEHFLKFARSEGLSVVLDDLIGPILFYFVVVGSFYDSDFNVHEYCGMYGSSLLEVKNVDLVTKTYLNADVEWVDTAFYVHLKEKHSIVALESMFLYMYQDMLMFDDSTDDAKLSVGICSNHILVCKALEFESERFYVDSTGKLTLSGHAVNVFTLGINGLVLSNGNLVICAQSVTKIELPTNFALVETVITIIGSILSLFGYLGTLLIYWMLASLRKNTCGKCVIALICSLFIGHTCFLTSSVAHNDRDFCQYLGVIQHVAWLSSMSWMNCASIDIWFTFRKWQNMLLKNPLNMYHCVLYSCLIPLVIVGTSILFNNIEHAEGVYGYGGDVCWLFSEKAILFFFVMPMGVMLSCSFALGVPSLINIVRRATADLAGESEKSEIASGSFSAKGIMKIAFLMGFVWLFGFLAKFLDSFALQLIYIVSGSCQGIFVFVFFAMTAHVRRKLMQRWRSEDSLEQGLAIQRAETRQTGRGLREVTTSTERDVREVLTSTSTLTDSPEQPAISSIAETAF